MPHKAVLSAAQQAALIALPPTREDLRLHYTLSENDLAIIRRKRGPHNRLGFAVQRVLLVSLNGNSSNILACVDCEGNYRRLFFIARCVLDVDEHFERRPLVFSYELLTWQVAF
jgi:hypothetical protein